MPLDGANIDIYQIIQFRRDWTDQQNAQRTVIKKILKFLVSNKKVRLFVRRENAVA